MSAKRLFMFAALAVAIVFLGPAFVSSYGTSGHALAQDKKTDGAKKAAPAKKKKRKRRILVEVDKVRMEPLLQTVPVVGHLVAIRSGPVATRINAPVASIKVDVGDVVKKGQVLATLVNDIFRWERAQKAAELAVAKAAIETAKARLALARQEMKRMEDLRTSAAFSRARLDDKRLDVTRYQSEMAESRAKVQRAQASLRLSDTELRYTRILAPYDGTITMRHTDEGAFIKEGQPVVTMISHRNLEIEADVPSIRVAGLAPGTPVTFGLGRKPQFKAEVRAVVPEENQRTRTRTVRFTPKFKTRPANLAARQSVTLHLPIGQGRTVLSVHKDALVTSRGTPTVFVIKDRRAFERPIRIGEGVGTRFEVLAGLKEGEVVVTRGNERLRDRRRVRINKAAAQ